MGPPPAVASARAACGAAVIPAASVNVGEIWGHLVAAGVFPSRAALAAHVVGAGGETARVLVRESGAGLRVSRDRSAVHFMGGPAAVARARLAVERILVPAETLSVGALWGYLVDSGVYESAEALAGVLTEGGYRRAAVLRAAVPGAHMRVSSDGARVFLMGPAGAVAAARAALEALIVPALTVHVSSAWGHLVEYGAFESAGAIVAALEGGGGALLREVEVVSGALVSVSGARGGGGSRLHVFGGPAAAARARAELDKAVVPSESIAAAARWGSLLGTPAVPSLGELHSRLEAASGARFEGFRSATGVRLSYARRSGALFVTAYATADGVARSPDSAAAGVAHALAFLDALVLGQD